MNLIKKQEQINIDGIDYVICFDMRSICKYKELTGRFFSTGINKLLQLDDEEIIYFIASTLRKKDNEEEPLGIEVLEGDILTYLINFKNIVINLIVKSLPTGENNSKKKVSKI